jgi:hypothetical protein
MGMIRALAFLRAFVLAFARHSRTHGPSIAILSLAFAMSGVVPGGNNGVEASVANSALATFGDRAAWNTAVGGAPTFLVDFESFASDAFFGLAPVDAGPFSIAQTAGNPNLLNVIDVPPYFCGICPGNSPNGTTFAQLVLGRSEVVGNNEVQITFQAPVVAFGADFKLGPQNTNDFALNQLVLNTASGQIATSVNTTDGFFGFIAPESFSTITFQMDPSVPNSVTAFGMDNVVGFSPVTAAGICRLTASLGTADAICAQATSIATAPNATAKASKLQAFDNFLAAQSGKSIPTEVADLLSHLAHLL